MSELYLIRHAQASFGSSNYDQLSSLGLNQSDLLGQHFKNRKLTFDQIYTGSLNRHKQTLLEIRKSLPDTWSESITETPDLNEYNFVELNQAYARQYPQDELVVKVANEQATKQDFFRLLRRVLNLWSKNHLEDINETFAEFNTRIKNAIQRIQHQAGRSDTALVVSSGGVISQFIASVLQIPIEQSFELNLQVRNASISRLYFNQSTIKLSSFNATPHLETTADNGLITYG